MKLFLTSNGFYTEKIKEQFLKAFSGPVEDLDVAIITTASPQKEHNRFTQKAKADFIDMGFQKIEFIDIEFEHPKRLLNKDIIYISGGNPFNLLYFTKQSGADKILRQLISKNVVIVGVSAGAVLLGPHIKVVNYFTPQMNTFKIDNLSSLGLTNKLIFPHYDREDLYKDDTNQTIEERLHAFENFYECEITRLKDIDFLIEEL